MARLLYWGYVGIAWDWFEARVQDWVALKAPEFVVSWSVEVGAKCRPSIGKYEKLYI
jgi:hypothetical protein